MASKLKNIFGKRFVILAFAFSITFTTTYAPIMAPRAQAFLGVGDVNLESIPTILKFILSTVGKIMAKKMVDDMVQSTIKWANNGFDGNPAFPTDWGRQLENTAKGVAGDYINSTRLSFLCSPFQAQIKLALIAQHKPEDVRFKCTLDQIGANYNNFVNNFDEGGWDAMFKLTQQDQNNPFGAYIMANANMKEETQQALGMANNERSLSGGFLNFKGDCEKVNHWPSTSVVSDYQLGNQAKRDQIQAQYPDWDPKKEDGACLKEGPVKTPGKVIEAQLNESLGAGLQGLIQANDIDGLVSAFANGLLQRYVFGKKGLIGDSSSAASREEVVDVDGDKIPDGYDTDGDGELNICHHGIKDSSKAPSNQNCIGSKSATNSPFFIPICKNADETATALASYKKFLEDNLNWNPESVKSWQNRTLAVAEKVDSFTSALSRYEINTFDKVASNFGQYSNHLNVMVNSLVKDKDITGDGLTPREPPWYRKFYNQLSGIPVLLSDTIKSRLADRSANGTIARTYLANEQRINYLRDFKNNLGQCDNPDIAAIDKIVVPIGAEGDSSAEPAISCSPSTSGLTINNSVTWYAYSTYNEASTTAYQWTGDDIVSSSNTTPQDLTITYNTNGTKSATLTATLSDGSTVEAVCSPSVFVGPSGTI